MDFRIHIVVIISKNLSCLQNDFRETYIQFSCVALKNDVEWLIDSV